MLTVEAHSQPVKYWHLVGRKSWENKGWSSTKLESKKVDTLSSSCLFGGLWPSEGFFTWTYHWILIVMDNVIASEKWIQHLNCPLVAGCGIYVINSSPSVLADGTWARLFLICLNHLFNEMKREKTWQLSSAHCRADSVSRTFYITFLHGGRNQTHVVQL